MGAGMTMNGGDGTGGAMDKMTLKVGTRMYNRGDMANPDHFGTITRVFDNGYGVQYEITPDADSSYGRDPYTVSAAFISSVDKGNGSTRIVTEEAHKAFREECIAAYRHNYNQNRIR